jgi:hypothetical protein
MQGINPISSNKCLHRWLLRIPTRTPHKAGKPKPSTQLLGSPTPNFGEVAVRSCISAQPQVRPLSYSSSPLFSNVIPTSSPYLTICSTGGTNNKENPAPINNPSPLPWTDVALSQAWSPPLTQWHSLIPSHTSPDLDSTSYSSNPSLGIQHGVVTQATMAANNRNPTLGIWMGPCRFSCLTPS